MNRDEYDGQMSIFEYLPTDDTLESKTLEQIAAELSMLVGVNFNKAVSEYKGDTFVEYVAKLDKNNRLMLDEGTYNTEDERHGKRYIGVGYDFAENHAGGGAPCDTIDEAVAYLRRRKQEYMARRNRRP